ncbi:M36 family metallopeptidase [Actinopolymorpha pittospori]|uniref:Fungalysin metallopeptidase (M36) n=1 Tax=Actinopolymorpha pittospori TaxID=648752 RepID=A0A927N569_9ACTN|nr:M36 family metallopeptidase [Actinopolymorpha pittospori]MBE1608740.1 hypothetical protein [Actinopolymorpha pittospori]
MRPPQRRVARVTWQVAFVVGVPALAFASAVAPIAAADGADGARFAGAEPSVVRALDRPRVSEDFDVRHGRLAPSADQRRAVERLEATVRWTRFGTAAVLTRVDGPLASGVPGSPAQAARRFLAQNRVLFRMSQARVGSLELLQDAALTDGGAASRSEPVLLAAPSSAPGSGSRAHVVVFRERFGGLPAAAGGLVTVAVAGDEIVYVTSSAYGDAPTPARARLSPVTAWLAAAAAAGRPVSKEAVGPVATATDPRQWTTFSVTGLAQLQQVRLVGVGVPHQGARPAYEANVVDVQDGTALASTSFVDAVTGRVLVRHNRVDHLLGPGRPLWRPSGAAAPPDAEPATESACLPGCGILVQPEAAVPAWHALGDSDALAVPGVLAAPDLDHNGTADNNTAHTIPAWDSPFAPVMARPARPRAPTGATSPAPPLSAALAPSSAPASASGPASEPSLAPSVRFTDTWRTSRCDTSVLEPGGNDVGAAVANVFTLHTRLHDWTYRLGFTEDRHNLQEENGSAGGLDGDREVGYVQADAVSGGYPTYQGRNDANQVTLQDGLPGVSNHYLFQPVAGQWYGPCVDGAFDASVVAHEYAHAVTNRLVGGPDSGITSAQGRAVAEGWSDVLAAEYLLEEDGRADTTAPTIGAYVAGNSARGVRNYRLDANPLNYGNVGYDPAGGLGADGEIWAAVNWDVRRALVEKYDDVAPSGDPDLQRRCADGALPAASCPGNRRWIQLVLDSLLLQQSNVSMLDARDALLAADRLRFGGANLEDLWEVFAARGMGAHATPQVGSRRGQPDFTVPEFVRSSRAHGRLAIGVISRPLGHPIANARIYVGRFADPSTPIADTDPATPLDDTMRLLPGRYELTWSAPGFGMGRASVSVASYRTRYLTLFLSRNLASRSNGARIVERAGPQVAGSGPQRAAVLDDHESTGWSVAGRTPNARGTTVTVDLAGTAPRWVRSVRISAVTADRFAALRGFAVETCTTRADAPCDQPRGRWHRTFTSPPRAFPATRPWPVTTDLTFRDFDIPDTRATHLRLVVLDTQCTGNPVYQGEQESDPLATSDCHTSAQVGRVALAELMVYGSDARSRRAPTSSAVWD